MSWLDGLRHRVRTVLHPDEFAREADEEAALHLELDAMQERDRDKARRRFGNRTYHIEERRRMTWLAAFDGVAQDFTYAWRSIRRSPGFTAAVIITLALGIGVNAASFSMLDTLYLRPPAGVPDPSSLRRVWMQWTLTGNFVTSNDESVWNVDGVTYPLYRAMLAAVPDTNNIALYAPSNDADAPAPRTHAVFATSNFFRVLGVHPALGRLYGADEDVLETGGAKVAVVSDQFWRARLGADTGAIGKRVTVGKDNYTVIGVMQPGFSGIDVQATDVWIPFAAQPPHGWMPGKWWENEFDYTNRPIMRVTPDMKPAGFEARATALARQHMRNRPRASAGDTLITVSLGPNKRALGPAKPDQEQIISTRLGGVAIIVLIIAIANVLNLLLGRAIKRRREIAVRLALGVSRWRLVRLLTTETIVLAMMASAAALFICWWSGNVLRALLLPQVDWYRTVLEWRVVWFTFSIGALCGIVAGVVPALQSSSPQLTPALKEGTRDTTGRRPARLRSMLVVVQAALSVVLLAGAMLFVRSLRNVSNIDIGFDRDQVVLGWAQVENNALVSSEVQDAAIQDIAGRLASRPEIERVARAGTQPMYGFATTSQYTSTDTIRTKNGKYPSFNAVTPDFFEATGLRILRGTTIDPHDATVVVNEAMAKQVWPNRDAIGECLYLDTRNSDCYRVTGIVVNGRRNSILEQGEPLFYIPLGKRGKQSWIGEVLIVRARPGAAQSVAAAMRGMLNHAVPNSTPKVMIMADMLTEQYRPWRLGAQLFSAVGLLALVVAIVGIYSTVSYGVSQRTQEFGLRIALGAQVRDVLRQVLGEGLRVAAIGVVVGIGLTIAGGKLIAALLYGVKPSDAATMVVVSLALFTTAAAATLIPAWRAARVDPAVALRAD